MGKALNVITGRTTNPGATITALTADTGDSFTVRNFPFEQGAFLEQMWAFGGTGGVMRIRSPRLHDVAQGIRSRFVASSAQPLLPLAIDQRLYPQDPLTVELSGGAAETDIGTMLVYYRDLPGVDARLATWQEVQPRIVNVVAVEVNFTSGATVGDYGGSRALNLGFDTLKRNVDYAVLGYVTDTACATIGLTGPDTGNLRVGGPGLVRSELTGEWFIWLAMQNGLPHIPVINAANVAATICDVVHSAAGTAINVAFNLAELRTA